MDPQAKRNSLGLVRSFLLRLSLDEGNPALAMEASAMARVLDDALNGSVEQEILASLGRIEVALGPWAGEARSLQARVGAINAELRSLNA